MDRQKFNAIIKFIAGAYLIYMAYNLPSEGAAKGEPTPTWVYIFVVLFIIAGAFFIISTIVGLIRNSKQDKEREVDREAERQERARQNAIYLRNIQKASQAEEEVPEIEQAEEPEGNEEPKVQDDEE